MTGPDALDATAVRAWCEANGMVLVSRHFWVAAANSIRKASGHATADEPEMTDAQAWAYVRAGVTREIAEQLEAWAEREPACADRLRSAAGAVRGGSR